MNKLRVPRLQIRWEEDKEKTDDRKGFVATYEMVLYEGEEAELDVRANDEQGMPTNGAVKVLMGQTRCSGGGIPFDSYGSLTTPFRDGIHIMRDSIRLGNLPMYVIYGSQIEEIEQQLKVRFVTNKS